MVCKTCGKKFTPERNKNTFCSEKCCRKWHKRGSQYHPELPQWFKEEWAAWKRDFMEQKLKSLQEKKGDF